MKTTKQILLAAADLIEQPGKWIKGELAKTEEGHIIPSLSCMHYNKGVVRYAPTCFCAIGAMSHVVVEDSEPGSKAYWDVYRAVGTAEDVFADYLQEPVAAFNDRKTTKQEDVVASLRECANRIEGE